MKPYPKYKESGVEWIEKIPSSWAVARLKSFLRMRNSKVGEDWAKYQLLSLTLRGIVTKDINSSDGKLPAEFNGYQSVRHGDLVFCLFDIDETPRTVGLASDDGMITSAYTVFMCNSEIASEHYIYKYFLHIDSFKGLRPYYTGLRKVVKTETFLGVKIPLPPLPEQHAIAAYLDRETAKIDTLIAKQEQLIALLEEKRQALISHAVTKGLDPNVEMKDSGVKWLGQVPEHWEVIGSNHIFAESKAPGQREDVHLAATQKYGVIPQREYMELEGVKVVQSEKEFLVGKHVDPDYFIMSLRSFQGGLEWVSRTGRVSPDYVALRPIAPIVGRYLRYFFKSTRYIQALQSTSNLVRDGQALRFKNFRMLDLLRIPESEQLQIADFLDIQLEKMNHLLAKSQSAIELLKEKRSALISAAVTGKIDVRDQVLT